MRLKTSLFAGLQLLAFCFIDDQGLCQPAFQRQFGGAAMEAVGQVALAAGGGFLIVGSTDSFGNDETDAYLIRVNPSGDTLWTRVFGGVGSDMATSVLAVEDDNWLVAGTTNSFGTGQWEAFLSKVDDTGALLWSMTYAMIGSGSANWLERTSDGGLIMTGQAGSGGPGMYLVRMTADGDTLWTSKTKLIGGSLVSMYGKSVVEKSSGEFLVFGDANDLSVCYFYFDQTGGAVSTGSFNGLQNYVNRLHVITVNSGGFLVTGTTFSGGSGALEVFAMRLDDDLLPLWTRLYGGTQSERASCVVETDDGGFAILGRTWSFGPPDNDLADVYLLKIDANGELQWSRTYGGSGHEEGEHMVQLPDGGFCIAGTKSGSNGIRDILLFTVDADGHGGCMEATPPTATAVVSTTRTSLNRQMTSGSSIGEPQYVIGHGTLVVDPCSGNIAVHELQASATLSWHQAGADIVLIGTNSNGYISVFDAFGRIIWGGACEPGYHGRPNILLRSRSIPSHLF